MRRTNPFAVLAGTTSSSSSARPVEEIAEEEYYEPPQEARWRWMGRTRTALRKENRLQRRREAAFAAEQPLPNFSGDRIVMYRLMEQVNAMPEGATKVFEISFTFHGAYRTKLIVKRSSYNRLEFYINENECVYIIYERDHPDAPFMSQLYADTADRRCFNPAPDTSQFRMLDLLMVFATKLMIAIKDFYEYEGKGLDDYYEEDRGITITDIAKKGGVALTPYKLLRGGDGIYERYGYVSPALDRIKARLQTMRAGRMPYEARVGLEAVLGRKLAAGELVMPLVSGLTWEQEQEYRISELIVDELTPVMGEGILAGKSLDLVLDRDSEAWAHWDAAMQLTGVRRPRQAKTRRRRRH